MDKCSIPKKTNSFKGFSSGKIAPPPPRVHIDPEAFRDPRQFLYFASRRMLEKPIAFRDSGAGLFPIPSEFPGPF
jgi:hypothetical protein